MQPKTTVIAAQLNPGRQAASKRSWNNTKAYGAPPKASGLVSAEDNCGWGQTGSRFTSKVRSPTLEDRSMIDVAHQPTATGQKHPPSPQPASPSLPETLISEHLNTPQIQKGS